MRLRRPSFVLSPRAYRTITLAAVILVGTIIVSGAAVRLTGSGLGCSEWPNCAPGRLTPHGAGGHHAWVEFLNRLFTGAVSISVIAAALGSYLRRPFRRDLMWLAWGLVVGVVGQIVLGGVTVLVDLHPIAVMSHMLLSLLILADAVVLHHRAARPGGPRVGRVARPVVVMGRVLLAAASVVFATGTVVTGTGPHAGDADVKRFHYLITDVARIHGSAVIVFVGAVLLTAYLAHRRGDLPAITRPLTVLLAVIVAQAAVGYTQYFTGVPAYLVAFHVAGAAVVLVATVSFDLALSGPVTSAVGGDAEVGPATRVPLPARRLPAGT